MAWPPDTIPPTDRTNDDPQLDLHVDDHNGAAQALGEIVAAMSIGWFLGRERTFNHAAAQWQPITYDPAQGDTQVLYGGVTKPDTTNIVIPVNGLYVVTVHQYAQTIGGQNQIQNVYIDGALPAFQIGATFSNPAGQARLTFTGVIPLQAGQTLSHRAFHTNSTTASDMTFAGGLLIPTP